MLLEASLMPSLVAAANPNGFSFQVTNKLGMAGRSSLINSHYPIAYYIPIFGLVENGLKPNIYMLLKLLNYLSCSLNVAI